MQELQSHMSPCGLTALGGARCSCCGGQGSPGAGLDRSTGHHLMLLSCTQNLAASTCISSTLEMAAVV